MVVGGSVFCKITKYYTIDLQQLMSLFRKTTKYKFSEFCTPQTYDNFIHQPILYKTFCLLKSFSYLHILSHDNLADRRIKYRCEIEF